jgi:uridine kinase
MVQVNGGSTKKAREKVSWHKNNQKEESTMASMRKIFAMVTGFANTMMDDYIEVNSTMAGLMVMESLSIQMAMSMMGNALARKDVEKESLKRHQLEELKEYSFMKKVTEKS